MRKKVLAALMIASMCLAGCQSSAPTNVPIDTPTATAIPEATKALELTESPVVTEQPEAIETPTATEAPKATEAPIVTEEPTATETPNVTEEPSETPETTPEVTPTDVPELQATTTPKPTEAVAPTATPVPTATVAPTQAPAPTATPKPTAIPKPTATPKPATAKIDVSKYLAKDAIRDSSYRDRSDFHWTDDGEHVQYWDYALRNGPQGGATEKSKYSQYLAYEITERPAAAGEPKTFKIKDSELNNEALMKKGLWVGDKVVIDSYEYNGQPVTWRVAYMQILRTATSLYQDKPKFSVRPDRSYLTVQYYLVSDQVLDNLYAHEINKVELYTGSQKNVVENDTDFTLDFTMTGAIDESNMAGWQPWAYEVKELQMFRNVLSIEKGDHVNQKFTATDYAKKNGLAVDKNGICESVWLDAERLTTDKNLEILDYAWLTYRKDGKLEFVKPHIKAGFVPELTLWASVDTTKVKWKEITTYVKNKDGGNVGKPGWINEEDIINEDIWATYADFVTWDWHYHKADITCYTCGNAKNLNYVTTKAHAYTYENWKDAVVNDNEVDLWENHYKEWRIQSEIIGYRIGNYHASDLENIEDGGFYYPQSQILLTTNDKTEQLTAFNAPGKVTWKSYDERVCKVDQNGLVTMGTHTGPTVVEAASGGKTMRVIVLSVTGRGPEWFEEMFLRAYRGERLGLVPSGKWWDVTLDTFKCFVDNGGSDYWKLFEDSYEAAQEGYIDCVDLVGRNENLLAPFFNIPGVEGICGVNGYTGHATTIAYLKGKAFFLDMGRLDAIAENGGDDGNIYGYKSGYRITERFTNGVQFGPADPEDCAGHGTMPKYPEKRRLYFYN